MMTMKKTISAFSISKSFTTGSITIDVLKGLTLNVFSHEMTLIVGPSGCGKSTLLALLSGLNRPDKGQINVLGNQLSTMDEDAIDRFRLNNAGFVFQGFNLFPALTAKQQVILPLQYLNMNAQEADKEAQRQLEAVGLKDRMHLRPSELSGGEKQRVAIARVLAKRPRILFADEPTSSLDKASGENIIQILHQVALEQGTTVLCVSHDPRLIGHADRVLEMEDGMIKNDTGPNDITYRRE